MSIRPLFRDIIPAYPQLRNCISTWLQAPSLSPLQKLITHRLEIERMVFRVSKILSPELEREPVIPKVIPAPSNA